MGKIPPPDSDLFLLGNVFYETIRICLVRQYLIPRWALPDTRIYLLRQGYGL
jgi:hypothetical protein